jgi:hypothetical protein
MLQLIVTANVIPILPILIALMMEATHSFEMSVLTRATLRHIPEDGTLHNHHRESITSHITLTGWYLERRGNVSPVR